VLSYKPYSLVKKLSEVLIIKGKKYFMKKSVLIIFLILTLSVSVVIGIINKSLEESVSSNEVLREIDTVCGDTWCEGDFNFKFHRLEFIDGKAKLYFATFPHSSNAEKTQVEHICELSGFGSPFKTAYRVDKFISLRDEFYSALTLCINEKIKNL
jgi:hypothetical protein